MKRLVGVALAICVISVFTNGQKRKQLEGTWKIAEIVVTGDKGGKLANPQPGLLMVGQKYYSFMYIPSDQERSPYVGDVASDKEKIDAFDSFFANAGTYELAGTTLTTTPMVAKNPGFEGGGFARFQVRLEGSSLWLTSKTGDFSFRKNGKVTPAAGPPSETTIKLVRLE